MLGKSVQRLVLLSLLLALLLMGSAHALARSSSKVPTGQLEIPQIIQPTSVVHLTTAAQTSTGRAPSTIAPTPGSTAWPLSPLAGNAAFAVELYPDVILRYIPNTDPPADWINVADLTGTAYFAGDFVGGDFSQVYVIDYYLNELHSLDTLTGDDTTIGAAIPLAGHVWTGATGAADGTLYASSTDDLSSHLYIVNTDTGATTTVGQITNASVIIDIAINGSGQMYGVDISTDNLVKIDPSTGAGTVIGSIGFDADYAQGMDFEDVSGVLYLAAFNTTTTQGELRIANTATGDSVLVGAFPDGAQVGALAFTPPPAQVLQNPGFENGWAGWSAEGAPILSGDSHSGSWSVYMFGETCWVWQEVYVPGDAIDVSFGYWLTGLSSDTDWDNDILIGGIWDQTWQTQYVDLRFGLTYFYSYPKVWRDRFHRLTAEELANVAGQRVMVGFQLSQDWNPGYHNTSSAWVDDVALNVTRPVYAFSVHLPLVVR
jgi:hypothetical protein